MSLINQLGNNLSSIGPNTAGAVWPTLRFEGAKGTPSNLFTPVAKGRRAQNPPLRRRAVRPVDVPREEPPEDLLTPAPRVGGVRPGVAPD